MFISSEKVCVSLGRSRPQVIGFHDVERWIEVRQTASSLCFCSIWVTKKKKKKKKKNYEIGYKIAYFFFFCAFFAK